MKKIAIINQRYGQEVNGGSEYYTRLLAEHLKKYYQVEILTTTALEYSTWANYYPAGTMDVNGIMVRRFPVKRTRGAKRFEIASRIHRLGEKLGISFDRLWIKSQGPYVPDLIRYIEENADNYEKFIFVTYLYYPTVVGIKKVFEKSILIPTAHDEPYIYYNIYKEIFKKVSAIIYLTDEEKLFVEKTFHNQHVRNIIAAVGIDIPDEIQKNRSIEIEKFRKKYMLTKEYIIYAGRVDVSKGCDEMLAFYQNYAENNACNLELVIIGKALIEIPQSEKIHYLGFVSDEEKMAAIAGANYLWLPSQYESLSISLLEGLTLGVPGIVNARCEVLKGHAEKSKAAFSYTNEEEFMEIMHKLDNITDAMYKKISDLAQVYVKENYTWDVIEKNIVGLINGEETI